MPIWNLASSDMIGVLPDITAPDIGDLRISQHPYSDIGVTDIGELRYHSITTPISEYQCSDIDSDIGCIVLRYRRSNLRYHSTSDIGVNIGALVLRYRSCDAAISEFPDIGDSDIGVGVL